MEIVYVYQKIRGEFGKHIVNKDRASQVDFELPPRPEEQEAYMEKNPCTCVTRPPAGSCRAAARTGSGWRGAAGANGQRGRETGGGADASLLTSQGVAARPRARGWSVALMPAER